MSLRQTLASQYHKRQEAFFTKLAADADKAGLKFLIIGGNAVNAYGYNGTTLDVDLLITDTTLRDWRKFWESQGYAYIHQTEAFCQFRPKDNPERLPVDLMIVSSDTYEKMEREQNTVEVGGQPLKAPSPLHLIAMKLHACRNAERARSGKDLQDIAALIDHCAINTKVKNSTRSWSAMPTNKPEKKSGDESIKSDRFDLDLPDPHRAPPLDQPEPTWQQIEAHRRELLRSTPQSVWADRRRMMNAERFTL